MQNWLVYRATTTPNRVALRHEDIALTYAQLWRRVEPCAAFVDTLPAGRLALYGENSISYVIWLFACLTARREVILLNTRLSNNELSDQLELAQCAALVYDDTKPTPDFASPLTSYGFMQCEANIAAGSQRWIQVLDWPDDAIATIMFTSGSTGRPKAVLQSFGNHSSAAISSVLNLGLDPLYDAWLIATALFHISGLSILFRCLIYGVAVELQTKFDPNAAADLINNGRVTVMSVVPQMLRDMVTALDVRPLPPRFRAFLLGGGFSEDSVLARCRSRNIPVVSCYGMSETCAHLIATPLDLPSSKDGCVGLPLFGVEVRLGDNAEIQLRSPAICVGYLHDQQSYISRWTSDGWFRTGDVGNIDEDGYLSIHTRLSELIISGGENIIPAEIERVLQQHAMIIDCAVVGIPDRQWGFVPIAFVVTNPQQTIDQVLLEKFCRERLAGYKRPRSIIQVAKLPRSAVGKLLRQTLIDDYLSTCKDQ